jgi:hypothetical protein
MSALTDFIISKCPDGLHMPKYNYIGAGTNLKKEFLL